ncbi:MAG: hypothetical protein JNM72_13275 [Deltaproteobacteria bacterium]|nr:hypothetical protein [Deltaproteobacteria bacterium]
MPTARRCAALGALLIAPAAQAGSGPWVIGAKDLSLYAGIETQLLDELALKDGLDDDSVVQVDDGIESTFATGIVTWGLRKRMEVELSVPWVRADANRPGGAVCASLGPRTCATTSGFGVVVARGKWQLLDELRGSPLSVSVGPELRIGQHTGPTRARITNLGEGTTDLGATLAVGRSGGLAEGSWSAHADGTYRRRGTNRALEAERLPGDELVLEAEAFFGARPWWSLGPTLSWWERPEGVDFGEGDLTDIDRFGALNGRNVRVGGKLLLRAADRTTLVVGGSQTVAARNNPRIRAVSLGLAFYPERRPRIAEGG